MWKCSWILGLLTFIVSTNGVTLTAADSVSDLAPATVERGRAPKRPYESRLRAALRKRLPRPDLVLAAVDSESAPQRRLAATGIERWYRHIPGSTECLRRLAQDEDLDVVADAIRTASHLGSRDAFLAVSSALDRQFTNTQLAKVADALDKRSFRVYWKQSDLFGLRDEIQSLIARRSKSHDLPALQRMSFPEPSRLAIESGRQAFQNANCVACHQVNGYGRYEFKVNLKGIGMCYDNTALVEHIHSPSLDLHDAGRQERFVTTSGQVILGRVMQTRGNKIAIQSDYTHPDRFVWIDVDDVELRDESLVSPMPTGLLSCLTPTQVADLVVFLRSDGGLISVSAGSHDHH